MSGTSSSAPATEYPVCGYYRVVIPHWVVMAPEAAALPTVCTHCVCIGSHGRFLLLLVSLFRPLSSLHLDPHCPVAPYRGRGALQRFEEGGVDVKRAVLDELRGEEGGKEDGQVTAHAMDVSKFEKWRQETAQTTTLSRHCNHEPKKS